MKESPEQQLTARFKLCGLTYTSRQQPEPRTGSLWLAFLQPVSAAGIPVVGISVGSVSVGKHVCGCVCSGCVCGWLCLWWAYCGLSVVGVSVGGHVCVCVCGGHVCGGCVCSLHLVAIPLHGCRQLLVLPLYTHHTAHSRLSWEPRLYLMLNPNLHSCSKRK